MKVLYRHFGTNDELLYIGISINILCRTESHYYQSKWFEDIARIEIEKIDEDKALEIERDAILLEKPKYNKNHQEKIDLGFKQYTFELDEDSYELFKIVTKENDSTAAQEIRKFIKEYLSKNAQLELK